MERSQSVEVCTVCHEHMEIFAVGSCNHPICYRCSSRMRLLCDQMYCPICRGDLRKVAFVQNLLKFEKIKLEKFKITKQNIYLENDEVEKAYKKLLCIKCPICTEDKTPDRTFESLRDHLRKEHTLFFCDLCLKHLNIFPFERKFYNRKDLATHRRVGDADDKSYKGHPLCVFCDERYMDNDELLRHLRKDHYFCHFCDADGTNEYYNDYPELKTHFRNAHFLCEEEQCGDPHTQFTNAFRSSIDLKGHKSSHHTRGMSKAQIREVGRLDIEIQLPPRRMGRDRGHITRRDFEEIKNDNGGRGRGRGYNNGSGRGYRNNRDNYVDDREEIEKAIEASKREASGRRMSWSAEDIRQDFPALSGQDPTSSTAAVSNTSTITTTTTTKSTSSNQTTNSVPKPTTSLASKISNSEKALDNANKAFPQLKKGSAKLGVSNKNSDNSGRNSPVIKDKKGSGRTSPVARVMQPVMSSKKVKEEDFPDLSASKNRNSNLISLGVWTQKSQRTDLVRPNLQPEKVEPPKPKPVKQTQKTNSNSLASVGMSLCVENDFPSLSGKAKPTAVNTKSAWSGMKKPQLKNTKLKVDDDFEIPKAATVQIVSTNNDNELMDTNSSKKKKKKKNKDKDSVNVNSESNVENNPPSAENKQKPSGEGKKRKSKKNETPASLDGIAMGLLNEEKDRTITKSAKQKNVHAMLPESESISKKKAEKMEPAPKKMVEKEIKSVTPDIDKIPVISLPVTPAPSISSSSDFPSLSLATKAPPPGFPKSNKKPPPGFTAPAPAPAPSPAPSRPPPGFGSTEEKKSLSVPEPAPVKTSSYSYIQPDEFQSRNQKLVQRIRDALGTQDKFDEFKTKSWQFRQNEIMASEYYYSCEKLIGKKIFGDVFTELLVLLPDITKQQDLLSVHNQSVKKLKDNVIKISGKTQKAPWSAFNDFSVCPTCGQVTLKVDSSTHSSKHVANDFPTLGKSKGSDFMGRGSWVAAK
ncbi:E3 ubiquitin-protein ligase ZNF598 [Patella vulgata]|uniref:E3 ubiquitin-protein ligase ZNF598 n=1 Tax=Patella vulgata TaxID=6465 RepID=UPI00217FE6A3|nr:E3 ubiquitin-protein ligase ZNF598 [Patella vulgata]